MGCETLHTSVWTLYCLTIKPYFSIFLRKKILTIKYTDIVK